MITALHDNYWQLADAKNRFSELARSAFRDGPQTIARRDGNVIVLSESDYLKLKGEPDDFKAFLLNATPDLSELDLRRDKNSMRDIEL